MAPAQARQTILESHANAVGVASGTAGAARSSVAFCGVPVVPVGRKAEGTLMDLEVKAMPWVRHPARGGATRFREELKARFTFLNGRSHPA